MLLDHLNQAQQEAAKIIDGPVMVFAGAGSGKTRTLTYRIAYMIEQGREANHILAITFTNRATNEMRERLTHLVGKNASQLTISTFHALCASILRKEIRALDYSSHFIIIDDEDQLKVIKEVIEEGNFNKKTISPKRLRKEINICKCFDRFPEDPLDKKAFLAYEEKMKAENLLDFEDLLLKVRELFTRFPAILERYQRRFQYILVDEFQDTDLIQYQIIQLLAKNHRNLFVVGDDDQSIYSFRGTNYENMKLFKKEFPEMKMIILNQNYRSTQTILDGCNSLISHNKDRQAKELFSDIVGTPQDVIVHQARDGNDEVDYVIDQIQTLHKEGYDYKDFAILYRSSVVSRNFELKLISSDIKYRVFGGLSFLRRREIKDIIAYFRLMVFHDDINSFKRIINEPSRGIGKKSVEVIAEYRKTHKITLWEALNHIQEYLPGRAKAISAFQAMMDDLSALLEEKDLLYLFDELLLKSNYLSVLDDDEDKEERLANIMEFKSILFTIENNGEIASRTEKLIAAFDEAILSDDKLQSQKHSNDGITLSTVHSVKGLEFRVVFIVAYENGLFPSLYRFEETLGNMEEERRIAYVASTRAKEKLYMTCAVKRLLYGHFEANPQSMFLLEFIKKNTIALPEEKEGPQEEKPREGYKIGDFVLHNVYGEGIVVSLNEEIGKICFTKQGMIKTFDMTHPAIRKKE